MRKLLLITCMLCGIWLVGQGQSSVDLKQQWVDSKLASMTLDEKIGQLFMIRAHSDLGADHIKAVENQIKKYHVGGLCFFQGTPTKQADLTNKYQQLAKTPLLIAIDGEWGLGMRFPKTSVSFPRQLALGAIQENTLIYEMGKEVASHMKRVGVHVNFAPVVDINNNPDNPVINDRSFGEDKYNVAAKSFAYMQGMQDGGIMACAKHFPGHGDTNVDSHLDLPVLPFTRKRLDSLELMPFRVLSEHGIQSVMVAHLHVPSLDSRANRATTMSANTIQRLLKEEIGFKGLIFTDALEMKGVTKHFDPGVVEAECLLAGNDVLLLPMDVAKGVEAIKKYLEEGKLTEERIDESVKKILAAKHGLGLTFKPRILLNDLDSDINGPSSEILKAKLTEAFLTFARNEGEFLPVLNINDHKMASLSIGVKSPSTFQNRLSSYMDHSMYTAEKVMTEAKQNELIRKLKSNQYVFVSIHDMSKYSKKDFGIDPSVRNFINRLNAETKVILTLFGSPYALKYFDDLSYVLEAYNEEELTQDLAAQALFGAFDVRGKLPITASPIYKFNTGSQRPGLMRLGYSIPERVGMSPDSLMAIDTIIQEMLDKKAAPGCQIIVIKDGKVVFDKAYGYHTNKKLRKVKQNDLYDVASITKIAASTISAMKLNEDGKFNLNVPMSLYLPELDTTDKKNLLVKDILAHHAGLAGWIPFYNKTIEKKGKKVIRLEKYYRKQHSDSFSVQVANDLYLRSDYPDTIWSRIISSELREKNDYRYSDLGFYMLSQVVHRITDQPLDKYAFDEFYHPLGLTRTTFNPLNKFPSTMIVPSEDDSYFRGQKVHGHVHDMGSAMLGGVAGHAGLFSNSRDLAVIMQMMLNGGYYGGKQYLNKSTIDQFTKRHPRSTRRAIGFDSKELNGAKKLNMCEEASDSTFGHLGFTGTCTFADPEHNIVYVFLSNRTYPSMDNKVFIRKNYRPRVQTVIYQSIIN